MKAVLLAAACAALAAGPVIAADIGWARPDFLPDDARILSVLDASPELGEARALLRGAEAERRGLAAGPHETMLGVSGDRRNIKGEGDFAEWSLQASRALRSPGKRALDLKAGAAGALAARDSVDDARHQASLRLAGLWIEWLQAEAQIGVDRDEIAVEEKEVASLRRRVELKDASVLELELAQAALARARAILAETQGRAEAARSALDMLYPGLAPARAPALAAPVAPTRALDAWIPVIIARSHEITIAKALADRDAALARRAKLDQRPDPTIGLRVFNERGGDETGAGLTVSIPFGGAGRSATAERQAAAASAAEARYLMVVRDVEAEGRNDVARARAGLSAWARASEATTAAAQAAERVGRAYALGERDLTDLLAARRQLFDVRRGELTARAAAQGALLRLALDAHELWLSEED
ncbi:TolC family protein [Caulobacter sp.]|uniref:TolC family protein n=1 Tax=Caulobacter sp. TaxID=78 RepID=UPI002B4A123C|nr:TolC family protein [Caulobacter sp.]HJV43610.1 TolC family protein [Caulobacter sp.]